MPTTYAIPDGRTVMAATLYTGNGNTTQSISNAVNGVSFQPDFVWNKTRSNTDDHRLVDIVRGGGTDLSSSILYSNLTNGQDNSSGYITQTSSGFDLGVAATPLNMSGRTYVAWQWKAGGTAVTNNDGSVTSQVSANTTAGFSVVKFTSPASGSFDVGHGLNAVPNLIITKPTSRSAGWVTYHSSLNGGNPGTSYFVYLNTTAGQASLASPPMWGSTGVTSSKFGASVGATCAGSESLIAYCFSAVAGYSAFGSYTGNNDANGPFVYLGFRPRFVMFKDSSTTGAWMIMDSSRDTYNVEENGLAPNNANPESTYSGYPQVDFLSNGFKIRANNANSHWNNVSGNIYIYAAFAENPTKFANAR